MNTTEPIPPLMPVFEQPVPDEDRLRWNLSGGWGMVIVSILLMIVGIVLESIVVHQVIREHQYRSQGQTVQGQVVARRVKTSTGSKGRTNRNYLVTYRFADPQNRQHSVEEDVGDDHYASLVQGGSHPVEYLPSDPTVSRLVLPRGRLSEWIMGSIGVGLLGIAGLMFFGNRKSGRRRAAVVFHGEARPAQIVVSEQRGRGKSVRYVLAYRYLDLAGQEKLSKDLSVSSKVMLRFPRGTLITAAIDPQDPDRPEPDLYGVRPLPRL